MRTALVLGFSALALGLVSASSGCAALLSLDGGACSQDSDCSTGQICNASTKVCVNASTPQITDPDGGGAAGEVCDTTDQCSANHNNEPWICRQDTKRCVPLLSPECTEILGTQDAAFGGLGWKDPNAFFIGVTAPLGGGAGDPDTMRYVQTFRNGAKLALDHIFEAGSLPGEGGVKRPLLGIMCDEWDLGTGLPQRVANHLINAGVQVVVSTDDGNTRELFNYLKPAGVANLCVFCGRPEWKTREDDGLQFTLMPPFLAQVPVGNKLLEQVEAKVRTETGMPSSEKIRVALVGPQQAGSIEVLDAYESTMQFNGAGAAANGANFKLVKYATQVAINDYVDPMPVAQAMADFKPHVIVYPGQAEMVRQVMPFIEASTPAGAPKPYYIADMAGLFGANEFVGNNENLRSRLLGTMPAPDADLAVGFIELDTIYTQKFGILPEGFYHIMYDGIFGTALAIAAAGNPPGGIKGVNIAQGLLKLQSADPQAVYNVSVQDFRAATARLREGSTISLKGRLVNFEFDTTTGVQTGKTAPWCISKDSRGNNYYFFAGGFPGYLKYDVKTNTFLNTNTFVCP